jgi:hypothetical protein
MVVPSVYFAIDVDHAREILFLSIVIALLKRCGSQFAVLSDNMKQNGFQCQRCDHLFTPMEHLSAGRAQIASA